MHKVLHLLDSAGFYGAERMIINLSRELHGSLFYPIIGAIAPVGTAEPEIITVARDLNISTMVFRGRSRFDFGLLNSIYRYLKNTPITILHSHGYKSSVIGIIPTWARRIPLVITCHLWFPGNDSKLRIYHQLESMVMQRASAVVGVSEPIGSELRANKIPSPLVHVIPNGIDSAHYRAYGHAQIEKSLQQLGIQPDDFVVGSTGRLHHQKDFPTLLKALARVRSNGIKVKGLILGEGPDRKALEALVAELGLDGTVSLPGYREDAFNLMERLDVFVLPSVMEGLPMVLLEAMSARLPIVTTPVGAVPSVVRDSEQALLFPVGDVTALSERITRLALDSELRFRLGASARRRFEEAFSSRIMAERYIELYKSLLCG
jgi:glycosyltransferase involved in cell wall biosynthesis